MLLPSRYISNFSEAYKTLQDKGLICEWKRPADISRNAHRILRAAHLMRAVSAAGTNPRFAHLDRCDSFALAAASRQFRFKSVVDGQGAELLELEHETRTVRHFQYMKHVRWVPPAGADAAL